MELKFKNITISSKEIYNEFIKYHNKKFGKKEGFKLFIMLLFIVYIIVFNIKIHNYSIIIIIACLALIGFFIHKVHHRETAVKKELKSPKI